jgi:hypothetical protein
MILYLRNFGLGGRFMKQALEYIIFKKVIENYTIIRDITPAEVDSVRTTQKIAAKIKPGMSDPEIEQLYMDNREYANVGSEGTLVKAKIAKPLIKKLGEAGKNRLLLENGEYIPNYHDQEYWTLKNDVWKKEKIVGIGITVPDGAIFDADLTEEQRKQIADQTEAERIANLSLEDRQKEKRSRLLSAFHTAKAKEEEAEFLGEEFDKDTWLQEQKNIIEQTYA